MHIFYSAEFSKRYKRLSERVRQEAKKKEQIFRKYPFDQRLKTHKLQGRMNDFWVFSIDFNYRIIFRFEEKEVVGFYAIGDHSIYQ